METQGKNPFPEQIHIGRDPILWALQEHNQDWYRDLVEHSHDLLCVHDLRGHLLSVNPAPARLLGYSVEEILQIPMREMIVPEFREQFDLYLKQVERAGEAHGFMVVLGRSGERRIWEFHNTLRTEGVAEPVVRGMAHDVTEQKRAEKLLRQASELNRQIIASVSEGVVVYDRDLRCVAWNPFMENLTGIAASAALGKSYLDLVPEIKSHNPVFPLQRALRGETVILPVEEVTYPGNNRKWISSRKCPLRDAQGEITGAIVLLEDQTDVKRAEDTLRQREADLRRAQAVAHVGSWRYDLGSNSVTLSEEAHRILGLSPGALLTGEAVMELIHPDDHAHVRTSWTAALGAGHYDIESRILVQGNTRWIHIQADIEFDSKGRPHAAVGTVQDVTEQKQAEAKFQALLEAAPDAMVVVDTEARMMLVNAQVERVFGYQRQELLGQRIEMLVPQRLREQHVHLRTDFFRAPHSRPMDGRREFVALHKDGHEFAVEITLSPLHTAEGLLVTSAIRDLTRRKRAEERLRQYEKAMEGLEEMIAVVDRDYRYVIANRAFLKYRGLENEQLVGRHIAEVINKGVFERVVKEKLDEALRGNVVRYEMKYTYPELGERDLSISYFPIEEQGRIDRVACVLQDITERKQAEEALRTSEREQHKIAEQLETERARLIEAQAVAKVGSWETELPSLDITWSEQTHRIFETDPSYFHPSRPGFVELVHPEDRAQVDAAFEASLEKGAPSTVEYRIVMADGRVKVLEEHWKVFHDGQGRPARLTGTCQDITERKQAEASLREVVEELRLAKERLAEEKFYLEQEIGTELGFEAIVGKSAALKEVMEQIGKVAPSDASVLLLGETGTGKELAARALHRLSRRAGNSFIKMNCAAIPSGLLESELFGYEKGAFTGSVGKKLGRLELADKGTLFLDEIGEIPLALQPKLLRVLQDQEFERLGGTQTLKVDFRLIAATNRDLAESVRKKEFRSDLYYRLNVFPVRVPPLRERREDIRLLVEHFVQKFAKRMSKKITSIPKKTIDALMQWEWPGNVRELENFVERSVILTHGSVLVSPLSELKPPSEVAVNETLEAMEREQILRALRASRGQIGGPRGAAARLGLKRTTLQSKLKQMGIDRRSPRNGP